MRITIIPIEEIYEKLKDIQNNTKAILILKQTPLLQGIFQAQGSIKSLQIATKRDMKGNGEKERYIHLNAEFKKVRRKDKEAFLSEHCKK